MEAVARDGIRHTPRPTVDDRIGARRVASLPGRTRRWRAPSFRRRRERAQVLRLVIRERRALRGTVERLDSMHRDLMAMSERSRANDDRLAGTIEAVHESLKKLVQLVEQNAAAAVAPKPRVPFAERVRRLDPQEASAETPEKAPAVMGASLRNRLAAAIPDFQDSEAAPNFGRAKRAPLEEKAPQPKESTKSRPLAKTEDASFEVPDDLVAAARRAAQAAALKVEERSGTRPRKLPGDGEAQAIAGTSGKRGRSFLIIFAA